MPQWMLFGAIIGPLAAVLLRLAPLGRCPTCEADVRGWEQVCAWCGNDVTGQASQGQPRRPESGVRGGGGATDRPTRRSDRGRARARVPIHHEAAQGSVDERGTCRGGRHGDESRRVRDDQRDAAPQGRRRSHGDDRDRPSDHDHDAGRAGRCTDAGDASPAPRRRSTGSPRAST